MAVDECGASADEAAAVAARQQRQSLEQQRLAAEAAAPAAGASAAEAAGDGGRGKEHDAADDSDDLTEDEDAGVRFVEEALQATPAELQDKLRSILDRRKKRLEQVRSGPRRLKRAGRRSDRLGPENSDAKKPLK
jgi:small-conductance mechanosensitive channel